MPHSELSATDKEAAFLEFKQKCATEGFIQKPSTEDDTISGICDDATLLRFLRARNYDVGAALTQFRNTQHWRSANQLIDLYESIDVSSYEETRKLYTHWTGRRDRQGSPVCLFEIGQLTSSVMTAYEASCSSSSSAVNSTQTESEATLRLFCTYENLTRFVLPLCSAARDGPDTGSAVTDTTCIVDISGVSFLQLFRLRNHMQAASALATAHYPETLGKTFVSSLLFVAFLLFLCLLLILLPLNTTESPWSLQLTPKSKVVGAPSFFPTVWGWVNKWFDQNTVSKICIVPSGKELATLSESIDPANIPSKYGGGFQFSFGMHPKLDAQLQDLVDWSEDATGHHFQDLPEGPMRWISKGTDGTRSAIAVGTEGGARRNIGVLSVRKPGLETTLVVPADG